MNNPKTTYIGVAIVKTNRKMEHNPQNIENDEVRDQVVQAARLVFAHFGYKKQHSTILPMKPVKGKAPSIIISRVRMKYLRQ
ncbi:MAG: hypothetical protein Q7W54_05630 [Bacteroidota bacterium]|nr:hypothetical protein [Bacteroidota bacterium]